MQLRKRVEKLEAKTAPGEFRMVHLIGVLPGETEQEACASYGKKIGEDDDIIFLVGKEPEQ